ncbi:MAG TPA: serine/threonine-protein kinase [Aggregatilineales bacterium]|nr:serine/threonine-protein kinase [Aggregatilineales bacterium]
MAEANFIIRRRQGDSTSSGVIITNGRLLFLARVAWVAVFAFTVVGTLYTLLARVSAFRAGLPVTLSWMPNSAVLAGSGISPDFMFAYQMFLEYVLIFAGIGVAIFLFNAGSNRLVPLLDSFAIVTTIVLPFRTFLWVEQPVFHFLALLIATIGVTANVAVFFVFPDGRVYPRWALWLLPVAAVWYAVLFFGILNSVTFGIATLWLMIWWLGGLIAQIDRYRRISTPTERQQIKWVLAGLGFITLFTTIIGLFYPLTPTLDSSTITLIQSFILPLGMTLSIGSLLAALRRSILRNGLWDVDLMINRSLVYGALTLVLLAVFGVALLPLKALFTAVLGGQQTTLATVVATALCVGLFQPTRKRMQHMVDHKIYKLRCDLDQFVEGERDLDKGDTGALSGKVLGHYQLGALIGRGGMGEVYQGLRIGSGQTVAIKTLRTDPDTTLPQEQGQLRLGREAEVVSGLDHPNVIKVYDFGASGSIFYVAMQYVAGENLDAMLRRAGKLSLEQTILILKDIASALDYVHKQGLVHRDVKPSNVLMSGDDTLGSKSGKSSGNRAAQSAILTDFGLIKILNRQSQASLTGAPVGTMSYMAPEQIRADQDIDGRADVYSLGVMAYQMLSGKLPFEGGVAQLLFAHLQQPPPDLCQEVPDLPREVGSAIHTAMAKAPVERFASAAEFVSALNVLAPVAA